MTAVRTQAGAIEIFDQFLQDAAEYRKRALAGRFGSIDLGGQLFHGISEGGPFLHEAVNFVASEPRGLKPTLTFLRKSPLGQQEPNYIHSDEGMGDWTGILYLNENPPVGDGTTFWSHKESGAIKQSAGFDGRNDWRDESKWHPYYRVQAQLGRLVIFPANYFHSRSIAENYGSGDESRLIQVIFGRYE